MELTSSPDFNKLDWYYRGEGNTNLVIAIRDQNIVVRISKTLKQIKCVEKNNYKEFFSYILTLINEYYLKKFQIIRLNKSDLKLIENRIYSHRPTIRLNKTLQPGDALICFDYAYLPKELSNSNDVFCVELKSKQGWIPLPDQTLPLCSFCLHQYYKLNKRSISSIGKYCPQNLFSGSKERMKNAIWALLENPQNNLRIFKNGQTVFTEKHLKQDLIQVLKDIFKGVNWSESEMLNGFFDILRTMLIREYSSKRSDFIFSYDSTNSSQNSCVFLSENHRLPEQSVLGNIFQVQKLNQSGLSKAYTVYTQLKQTFKEIDQWDMMKLKMEDSISENIKTLLNNYLLFSTFRDCSIMLTFQRTQNQNESISLVKIEKGIEFQTNVGITDVDPKKLYSLEKHYQQTNLALNYYQSQGDVGESISI